MTIPRKSLKDKFRDSEPETAKLRLEYLLKQRDLTDKIGSLSIEQSLGILADVISSTYQERRLVEVIPRIVSKCLFLLSEYGVKEESKDIMWQACLRSTAASMLLTRLPKEFKGAEIAYSIWNMPNQIISVEIKESILDLEKQLFIQYSDKTELATEEAALLNPNVIWASGSIILDAAPRNQILEILTHLYSCSNFEPKLPIF